MKYAIGVDLGGTRVKAGLVAADGRVVRRVDESTPADAGAGVVALHVARIVEELSATPDAAGALIGAAVGSPGLVDAEAGLVRLAPNLRNAAGDPWRDVPLLRLVRESLAERSRVPLFLENDVNAMVLAESAYGAGRGSKVLIGMTLGTGVGGGIVIDGKVHRGSTGTAGEVGHVTVVPNGPRCGCGNDGCLEALVGSEGLVARARSALDGADPSMLRDRVDPLTPMSIAHAAEAGDVLARVVFEETGRYIGIVLAGVANLLNPDVAVIGGGIATAGEELLFRHIRAEFRKRTFDVPRDAMRIVPAELGSDAGLIGCAAVAFRAA